MGVHVEVVCHLIPHGANQLPFTLFCVWYSPGELVELQIVTQLIWDTA